MCGIYGTVAAHATQKVFNGIKRIEYRGYDSWGVAGLSKDGQILVDKRVGKIGQASNLKLPAKAKVAIGHTRWATHGGVTKINAHPHLASDGSFALVQNGVVENYQPLKKALLKVGYKFKSETDTEVIVRQIEQELKKHDLTQAIIRTVRKLAGRSTILVMTQTGDLYAYRFGSPLVIGKNQNSDEEVYLSSDVLSLAADVSRYYNVNNQEFVSFVDGRLEVRKISQSAVSKPKRITFKAIDVEATQLDKENYDHFMLKEIFEQGQVLHRVADQDPSVFAKFARAIKQAQHVYTLGAGSASFAAGQTAFFLREKGINASVIPSYEARSYLPLVGKNDICIAFSQSGETADTNEVIEQFKDRGVTIASIVNMAGSSLAAMSDFPFPLQVGPEVGVASTKALTGHMVWGKTLAEVVAGTSLSAVQKKLFNYQKKLATWLKKEQKAKSLKTLAKKLNHHDHAFILGRGQLYYPTLEFALKIKEISYIHAEGFSGGELKHGVIALVEKGTPVVCLVTRDSEESAMLNAAAEVKARGAHVIGVADRVNELFDDLIQVPADDWFGFVGGIVPSQLLTYHLALLRKLDPDKPRNLAKSVTVR